jgi:NAD(P)H dehydrogenase (quinone)
MYAVMGATGKVGGSVARTLLQSACKVRVIVRNAAKARSWTDAGCEVAVADLDEPASLADAFRAVDGVFVMLPPQFDPSPDFVEVKRLSATLRHALEAARAAKVVCLSSIGADAPHPNLLSQLGLLEQSLRTLPLPVTMLRAAWFIDNAALDVADARSRGAIRSFLQPLDQAFPMIASADVGVAAAQLLQETWRGSRVVEVEGPRRVTPRDIAAAFATVLDRPISVSSVPRDEWQSLFHTAGMRNPTPRMQMLDGFNAGWIRFAADGAAARHMRTGVEQVIRGLV